MDAIFTVVGIFIWIPPIVVAIFCGGIGGVFIGFTILLGELAVLFILCMIAEALTDDPND